MKKIFILTHAMELGGAERALLGLLDHIDYSKYEVDLFLMRQDGELLEYIDSRVNILPSIKHYSMIDVSIKKVVMSGNILIALGRILGKYKSSKYIKDNNYKDKYSVSIEYAQKYVKCFLPQINAGVEYDLAISFLTPHYIVTEKVKAKKKVAWIHTDYSFCQVDIPSELNMWGKYDKIVSISESVTKAFVLTFPSLREKIIEIENIQPTSLIYNQMNRFNPIDEIKKEKGVWTLLSIGRFCNQKNFDNIPSICKKILSLGIQVKWFIIGFGLDEKLIRKRIAEEKMEEYVIILGKKKNPYPYIKACDLYVQPSRYEGKAVTVREAQLLGKPVVITRYPTAQSQLEDGVDGIVVPMDNEGCANGIVRVLENQKLMNRLVDNCKKRDYSGSSESRKIENLFL